MSPLSPRQSQIMRLRARGLTTKEIAHELGISVVTVKNNITFAYAKLGVENLAEFLLAMGWLRLPDDEEVAA
jgi:DNA-binding NarL/FixJ family response regulator